MSSSPKPKSEMLALLCPKGNCFDARGRGGMGVLRPEDIAIACAGLSERVFLFGLYTVVNDRSVQPQVIYYAHLEVVDLAIERGWKAPKGSMVWRKMAILALCEVIGVDCATCERRGKVQDDKGVYAAECPACGGSCRRRFTAGEREEALGMSGRRWLFRYELVYRRISAWRTTLDDHLRLRLARVAGAQPDPTFFGISR